MAASHNGPLINPASDGSHVRQSHKPFPATFRETESNNGSDSPSLPPPAIPKPAKMLSFPPRPPEPPDTSQPQDSPSQPSHAVVYECPASPSGARPAAALYPLSTPSLSTSSQNRALFAGPTSSIGGESQFNNLEGGGQVNNLQGASVITHNTHNFVYNIHNSQAECQECWNHGPQTHSSHARRTTYPNYIGDSNVEHRSQRGTPTELRHPDSVPLRVPIPTGEGSFPVHIPSIEVTSFASVNPSRGNGNSMPHVGQTPGTNYLEHLIELACGLECLHNQGVVHGSLRDDNATCLLNSSQARSTGGSAKALPENNDPRWLAPEAFLKKTISKHSDIWSFGMVCLAILSGDRPFAKVGNNFDVVRELLNGNIPERPGKAAVERGLSDAMWELLCRCWQQQPESRPPITEVKNALIALRGYVLEAEPPPPKTNRSATFPLTKPGRPGIHPSTPTEIGVKPPTPTMTSRGSHGHGSTPSISGESSATTHHSSSSSNTSCHTSNAGHSSHKVHVYPQPPNRPHPRLPPLDLGILPHTPSWFPAYLPTPPPTRDGVTSRENGHPSPDPDVITGNSGDHAPPWAHDAVTTLATIVALDASGAVQGGTLGGLLDRLITNINSTSVEYRDILLMGCAELTTPNHLFSILSRRFYEAKQDPRKHPQERVTIQLNTLTVMMHWLSTRYLTGEAQLLMQVRSFCGLASSTQMAASDTMMRKVTELIRVMDRMPNGSTPSYRPDRQMLQSSQMKPHDLAIALTLLEGDKYTALTPTDCLLHLARQYTPHLQGSTVDDRVEDAYTTNNQITRWIQDSILYPGTLQGRAETLKFFINTADECRKLHNFSSFVAIVSALHSPPIARLKLTKAQLDLPMQRRLESLQKKINPSSNHSHYRKLLKEASDTKEWDRCVPWLSVHLEYLRLPLQEHLTLREVDGRMLINFHRYVKFMDRIKEVLHYRAPNLESFREQGQLAYLEHQLHTMRARAQSGDDFMNISEAREPYSRAREGLATLRVLGFRTSQS